MKPVDLTIEEALLLQAKLSFRVPEVARVLSMSESKIKQLIRTKSLSHIKEEGVTLVTRAQVQAYLRKKELEQGFIAL